jgi:predicted phosphodiesterase
VRTAAVRRALISDIHGNLESLDAVLHDIATQHVDEIFCLGDVVGYGPNPRECIDRVMNHCRVTLLGNHDQGLLWDQDRPNGADYHAISRTRMQLEGDTDAVKNDARKEFLIHLPRTHEIGPYLFVHGSPRSPLTDYIFPEDIYNRRKMGRLFQLVRHYCFHGHTHVPGIITDNLEYFSPDEINDCFDLGATKLLIDVGSVGQPRDGDNRACYVILDEGGPDRDVNHGAGEAAMSVISPRITFRRLSYDFEFTNGKIRDIV